MADLVGEDFAKETMHSSSSAYSATAYQFCDHQAWGLPAGTPGVSASRHDSQPAHVHAWPAWCLLTELSMSGLAYTPGGGQLSVSRCLQLFAECLAGKPVAAANALLQHRAAQVQHRRLDSRRRVR